LLSLSPDARKLLRECVDRGRVRTQRLTGAPFELMQLGLIRQNAQTPQDRHGFYVLELAEKGHAVAAVLKPAEARAAVVTVVPPAPIADCPVQALGHNDGTLYFRDVEEAL
jgi:hypothetical protein